ncbi:flavodoxin [Shewanella sp. OPT22]|nr:flavodoxin [Shewanella sp. OPT22]
MVKVNIVFGTVYGSAQFVAETVNEKLIDQGYDAKLWQPEELVDYTPAANQQLIVISSTTGQGDLPDGLVPWFEMVRSTGLYLPDLHFSVIGLGDSSYETYCGAGEQLQSLFEEIGAQAVKELFRIDACETMEPELEALNWLDEWTKSVTA